MNRPSNRIKAHSSPDNNFSAPRLGSQHLKFETSSVPRARPRPRFSAQTLGWRSPSLLPPPNTMVRIGLVLERLRPILRATTNFSRAGIHGQWATYLASTHIYSSVFDLRSWTTMRSQCQNVLRNRLSSRRRSVLRLGCIDFSFAAMCRQILIYDPTYVFPLSVS